MKYVVREGGERIDRIARAIYGTELGGTVEALLAANPGLAARGPFVEQGISLTVPVDVPDRRSTAFQLAWE
jgi:phage tail protein X